MTEGRRNPDRDTGPHASRLVEPDDEATLLVRSRLALEGAGFAAWDCNPDTGEATLDPRWNELRGGAPRRTRCTVDELLEFVHPDDRELVHRHWVAVIKGEVPRYDLQYRVRKHDGTHIWVRVWGAITHRDENDRATRFTGLCADVTREREAAQLVDEQRRQLRTLFDSAPVGLWLSDETGRMRMVNRTFCHATGISEERYTGAAHYSVLFDPATASACMASDRAAIGASGPVESREKLLLSDGRVHDLEITKAKIVDEAGNHRGLVGMALDVTERNQIHARLRLLASAFESAREGILITDGSGVIVDVNRRFTEITGYPREEALGMRPSDLDSGRQDEDFYDRLWKEVRARGWWTGEIWCQRKGGEIYPEHLTITQVPATEEHAAHHVGVFSDLSEIYRTRAQLARLTNYDPLTDLPNRVALRDYLRSDDAASPSARALHLYHIDVDQFHRVIDRVGAEAANQVLVELARRLGSVAMNRGLLAHLGADEFVLVCDRTREGEGVEGLAGAIAQVVADPIGVSGEQFHLTCSIGVVSRSRSTDDPEHLLRQANIATYEAKRRGGNCLHVFDHSGEDAIRARIERRREVVAAIERGEFVLAYQPQVDMQTGRIDGFEALVRWHHPQRGVLLPGEFLPDIEDTEDCFVLDRYVLGRALDTLAGWRESHPGWSIAVNISPFTFMNGDLVAWITDETARRGGVRAGTLELEVVESAAIANIGTARDIISRIRELGIRIALDDFGVGFASLSYLRELPCDRLKVDRSFVSDMVEDRHDMALVSGVISLAKVFEREVIAEGVETPEQGVLLLRLGCTLAQGWGIARPMPLDQIEAWAARWRPDESWKLWSQIAWDLDDLPLVTAGRDHVRWIDSVMGAIEGRELGLSPEEVRDPRCCRFGRWFYGRGLEAYGTGPNSELFWAIEPLHEEVHELGCSILEAIHSGDKRRQERLGRKLLQHRDQVVVATGELARAAAAAPHRARAGAGERMAAALPAHDPAAGARTQTLETPGSSPSPTIAGAGQVREKERDFPA